jgi:hypothetical protein
MIQFGLRYTYKINEQKQLIYCLANANVGIGGANHCLLILMREQTFHLILFNFK